MDDWGKPNGVLSGGDERAMGRITQANRGHYHIGSAHGVLKGRLSGKMRYLSEESADYPVVGDWVCFDGDGETVVIRELMPRRTLISRKAAGVTTTEQPLAANVDVVAIVQGLDGGRNYSSRGLERFLTLAWNSGARPVILLNKADLADDPSLLLGEAENAAPGVDILLTSAVSGLGLDEFKELVRGKTAVLIGPSGVGKSALSNALIGRELQKTGANRDSDKRGRHTTTGSVLIPLSGGGWLIDSPGLKEVQLWGDEEGVDSVFSEIDQLAEQCRFRDCSHEGEPGCAVQRALEEGVIDPARYQSYRDLKKEMVYLESRQTEKGRHELKQKHKQFGKFVKNMKKGKEVY